jgi:hypothetical protein
VSEWIVKNATEDGLSAACEQSHAAIAGVAIVCLAVDAFRSRLKMRTQLQTIADRVAQCPSAKERIADVAPPMINAVDNAVGGLTPQLTRMPPLVWPAIEKTVVRSSCRIGDVRRGVTRTGQRRDPRLHVS